MPETYRSDAHDDEDLKPEIWRPEDHERFLLPRYNTDKGVEVAKAEALLAFEAQKPLFWKTIERLNNHLKTPPDLGAEMGKAFIETMRVAGNEVPDYLIKRFKEVSNRALKAKIASESISGFMGEMVIARTLHDMKEEVYFPKTFQDTKGGVDWWIDRRAHGQGIIALQVFLFPQTVKFLNESKRLIYPIHNDSELSTYKKDVLDSHNMSGGYTSGRQAFVEKKHGKVDLDFFKQKRMIEKYGAEIVPAFLALPGEEEGVGGLSELAFRLYDEDRGTPTPLFIDRLRKDLDRFPRLEASD